MNNWLLIIITLLFSAFFSGVEIAYATSNRLRIELDLKKNKFNARLLNGFYKNQGRFIGSLLLGTNISLVIYGTVMASMLEPRIAAWLPLSLNSEFFVLFIQTIISTILILIVGEFLPKILFRFNPNGILNALAVPIWIIYYAIYPLVIVYILIVELILKKIFRMEIDPEGYAFSSHDLNEYVREFAPNEESEEQIHHDIQLFQNAIDFRFVKLRECMVHRTAIEAITVEANVKELLARFEDTKHSKVLVYQDNIDNIIGYVHSYDMFRKPQEIREVLRSIENYPETYPANILLTRMTQSRQSIAVVVDEFGGTSGIVTIEDIIEEIFGEIDDEFDVEETIEEQISGTEFVFSTGLEIDYLNENYKLDLPKSEEYETLAGYILDIHESIPALGEEIIYDRYKIIITKARKNRLEEVRIKLLDK